MKYRATFKLGRIDHPYSIQEIGAFDVLEMPLTNIEGLIDILVKHAKDLEEQPDQDAAEQAAEC